MFFKSATEARPEATITLKEMRVAAVPASASGRQQFAFELAPAPLVVGDGGPPASHEAFSAGRHRKTTFCAESACEQQEWMGRLRLS